MMKKLIGFTLIELLVSLAILVILTVITVPSLAAFTINLRVDNEITAINRLLFIARNMAINSGQTVTLCPLGNDNQCTKDWHKEISVFIDSNNNKKREVDESIVFVKQAIKVGDKLQYGKTRIGLTYANTGHLSGWGQNATFTYCPKNHADKSRGIIVAVSGRIYQSFKKKTNKADKNRSNKTITCY